MEHSFEFFKKLSLKFKQNNTTSDSDVSKFTFFELLRLICNQIFIFLIRKIYTNDVLIPNGRFFKVCIVNHHAIYCLNITRMYLAQQTEKILNIACLNEFFKHLECLY